MDVLTFVGLAVGLGLLVYGANLLVRGSGNIARRFGISSLVVGLTVVAYGTSAPEMAVSVSGAAGGEPGVALGNVLGSTVANVLLILGVSALFGGLVVRRRLIRLEVPIMIAITAVAYVLALNGVIGRLEGLLLIGLAVVYTVFTVMSARKDPEEKSAVEAQALDEAPSPKQLSVPRNAVLVVLGLAGLVVGSQLLVNSAVDIAAALGLSEVIIGLTVVAVGTSLPELATSIAAALKGDRDLAVGNAIGSNIFNVSVVLGLSGLVSSTGLPVPDSVLSFDFLVAIAVCIACLPIFFTGHCVKRWEGAVFVTYYVVYVTYLVLDANGHDRAQQLGTAMLGFVLPLTLLTLAILVFQEVQQRRKNRIQQAV